MRKIILTVDLEKDFGVLDSTKCMKVLPKFTEMLDRNKIKATFFVNGELLPKFNKELKAIAKKHEIACHGLNHERLTDKPIEEVRAELKKSKNLFKKNLGVDPVGFRAPYFMVNDDILKTISEAGFKYDSSLVPGFLFGRYCNFKVEKEPYYIKDLLEIPVSRVVVPLGSTWFQFVGKGIFSWLFWHSKRYNNVIYTHMNEFCPDDFNLDFKREVFYWNRGEKTLAKFEDFLKECKNHFNFMTAKEILKYC